MSELDRSDTPASDIAVEITKVYKTYRQRQRSERFGSALSQFFRPRFETITALNGVDLTLSRGEIAAYAGPNGAGKSTTIKMLSGLLSPDSGRVRVLGMDPVRHRVTYVRRIGVVFGQRTDLWWDHPVASTYDWKRVVWNIERRDYDRMVAYVKDLLGLEEFFYTQARELSLGQRMRADLGLALLHEPEVMFLDEPTLGLDVLAKKRVLQSIVDLNRERGMTVLVTSHDMPDLENLASRIVMIHKGSVAFDGDFDKLRRTLGDRRRVVILADASSPPVLPSATLVRSESGRFEYSFDALQIPLSKLLEEAGEQVTLNDVEIHREYIDEVVSKIYEQWLGTDVEGA